MIMFCGKQELQRDTLSRMEKQASPELSAFGRQVLDRYGQSAPTATAVRLAVEATFSPAMIEQSFEKHAVGQYTDQLPFSMMVDVMSAVVTNRSGSVHSAIKSIRERASAPPSSRRGPGSPCDP